MFRTFHVTNNRTFHVTNNRTFHVTNNRTFQLICYFHRPKPTTVVMLIDTSGSGNHGNKLYQSMIYHQEKPPTLLIKRLLLSSVFHSLAGENEEQQHQQLDISKADMNICVS